MKNAVIVSVLLGCASIAHGEESTGDVGKHDLETVTVQASKKMSRAYDDAIPVYSQSAVQESAKASTEIFTREDIDDIRPRTSTIFFRAPPERLRPIRDVNT